MRATFSLEGRRVLPHWGEKLGRCRLMVEHADRVLFVRDGDRRVLPGGPLTGQKTGMDLGNLIGPLDCMVVEQSGLKVPWMTFIGDWPEAGETCRIYAYTPASAPSLADSGAARWMTPQEIEQQVIGSRVGRCIQEAILAWHDETIVRGMGASGQQAQKVL